MPRIRVAKTGGNVDDDPKDLVLDTDFTGMMVLEYGAENGSATEITHNLGYYPLVYSWFEDSVESNVWHPEHSGGCSYSRVYQDTNKIYIDNQESTNMVYMIFGNAVDNSTGTGTDTSEGMLKVGKDGDDITGETDIRKFQFASSTDLIKRDDDLSGTVTSISDDDFFWFDEITINHNLGYIPFVSVLDANLGGELPLIFGGFNEYYYRLTTTQLIIGVGILAKDPEVTNYSFDYQIYRNKIVY